MEVNPASLEEVFNELEAAGINASFYVTAKDFQWAKDVLLDALTQIINIHIYASYDHKFEVDDEQHLYDIVHLNMKHSLQENDLAVLHKWIDDVVMQLAIGALSLDGFTKDCEGENLTDGKD